MCFERLDAGLISRVMVVRVHSHRPDFWAHKIIGKLPRYERGNEGSNPSVPTKFMKEWRGNKGEERMVKHSLYWFLILLIRGKRSAGMDTILQKEISKCVIMCANCHLMEHERLKGC